MVADVVVGGAASNVVVVVNVEARRGGRARRAHGAGALERGQLVVLKIINAMPKGTADNGIDRFLKNGINKSSMFAV